jgi:light-regulated signal transduction histidine kinase (bacteriophytochrome)
MEESLRDTQARLNSTLAAGSIGTWTWDIVNDRLAADEFTARVFSIEPEAAARGLPADAYLQAVLEGDRASVADGLARAIQSCGDYDLEYRVRQKDGEPRWLQARGRVDCDAAGKALNFHGAVMDITARKQAEEEVHRLNADLEERVVERTAQLESANKELEAFSYSVSHDLRSPLRAIDGFSQAVIEDFGPQLPGEGQGYLKTIRDEAQRMGRLIDDLLAFSRLSRVPLSKRNVDTGDLVRGVLDDLKPQRDGRTIDLRAGELPACSGDASLLKQVWINLLSNAFKYTLKRDAVVVEIGSRVQDGETVYFVRDNGSGFDMRYAGKLFGVFQRLHRADEYEGTGVGLALVQRIVNRHGGRVWAEAAVDQGATFYFTLAEETKP